jgi:periplasmic protein TonB
VGPPSDLRSKGPMILRREDDLTKVPKGQMVPPAPVAPTPPPVAATPAPPAEVAQKGGGAPEVPGREGLRIPPGLLGGSTPRGDEGRRARPGELGPSVAGAVDGVARRLERDAQMGLPTGTGQNQAGLYFDPQGADFTLWINTFKNEVYRNWIVPQVAQYGGARGHVDFEFTVERNGSMSALRMMKSSGTVSLDRAAQFALSSSRFLPLPDDYGPPRVTMQVTFFYNEAPQGS